MKRRGKKKREGAGGWYESPWASPGHDRVKLRRLLGWQQGDGRQCVWVSFYAAPELVVAVRVDSGLALELPEPERYTDAACFRTVLDDELWRVMKEAYWGARHGYEPPVPRYRRERLLEEAERGEEDETADEMWRVIEANGCTWMAGR